MGPIASNSGLDIPLTEEDFNHMTSLQRLVNLQRGLLLSFILISTCLWTQEMLKRTACEIVYAWIMFIWHRCCMATLLLSVACPLYRTTIRQDQPNAGMLNCNNSKAILFETREEDKDMPEEKSEESKSRESKKNKFKGSDDEMKRAGADLTAQMEEASCRHSIRGEQLQYSSGESILQ
jgi:hypothetical protein